MTCRRALVAFLSLIACGAPPASGDVALAQSSGVGIVMPVPVNTWPDPQLQVSEMGTVTAENAALTGLISALPISGYSFNADYTAGTATFSNGSTAVTGSGTAWTTNLQAGDWISVPSQQLLGRMRWYPVAAVNSDTSLTLGYAYAEATISAGAYVATGYFSRTSPGRRLVTVSASNTYNLKVGDLVSISTSDPALSAGLLRVLSVTTNTSFTVRPEYTAGRPQQTNLSTNDKFIIQRQGDLSGAYGSGVTPGVRRFANGSSWPVVELDDTPTFTSLFHGAARVALFQKVTSGTEYLYWTPPAGATSLYANAPMSVGAAVVVPSPASGVKATAYLFDGSTTTLGGVATAATRTWTAATATLGSAPTNVQVGVQFQGPAGTWFIVAEFFKTQALGYTADGVFSTPVGQSVTRVSSLSPWNGQEVIGPVTKTAASNNTYYDTETDFCQQSAGHIGPGVTSIFGLIEGQTDVAGGAIGFHTALGAPTIFSHAMFQTTAQSDSAAGTYMTASGMLPLLAPCMAAYNVQFPGERFEFLSWDMSRFVLWSDTN